MMSNDQVIQAVEEIEQLKERVALLEHSVIELVTMVAVRKLQASSHDAVIQAEALLRELVPVEEEKTSDVENA